MAALANSNANVGGNYLTLGAQSYNIRGLGLINDLNDIENVMVAEKDGTPIFVKTLGKVTVGHRVRLGKVGIDDRDDVVEGVVLLQRGAQALPVLDKVRVKVEELNGLKLPSGVKIKTFYDRTALINTTVKTVTDILISGMVLVFIILVVFLGDFRAAFIVALTIPLSLLFTFTMMVFVGAVCELDLLGRDRLRDHRGRDVGDGRKHLCPARAPEATWAHDSPIHHTSRRPGRKAYCLFHGDHRGGVCAPFYDDRSSWEDLRAHVHYLWVCSARCTLDGVYARARAVFIPLAIVDQRNRYGGGRCRTQSQCKGCCMGVGA